MSSHLSRWLRELAGASAPVVVEDPEAARHFRRMESFSGAPPPGWIVDFLGIRTQWKFVDGHLPHTAEQVSQLWQSLPSPQVNGLEYFEWLDLLHAVLAARDRFVMVELGAGWGRWAVRAAKLLERLNPMPYTLVAVEAEPTHFGWLQEHFADNGIDPAAHHLVAAPVAARRGDVRFLVGKAAAWYGQSIVGTSEKWEGGLETVTRRGIPLAEILEPYSHVDMIDLDIQEAELDVLSTAIGALDERARRLQVATHGAAIERGLRRLFSKHGWELRQDFPCGSKIFVPALGRQLDVDDGVQSWINPRQ
jgi:FkbM family methyltransferase